MLTTLIYLIWRTFYTLPWNYGLLSICFGLFLWIAEAIGMVEQMVHFCNTSGSERPKKPKADEKDYPSVDVFIATYNEPVELLYKTVNGCVNMEYPDREKMNIYLCDDGNREEVKQLAEKFGIGYLARTDHEGAKAGNLNYALEHSDGKLVVTFDADMIPMRDFLMATVPYFVSDLLQAERLEKEEGIQARKAREGKIGFIQTPQSFYNLDLFQYNLFSEERIPNEQDYFYRDIELGKNKVNSVIYGGSNTVLAREALEEIGGFVTSVITEDFATGMLIQSEGYQCFATDEVHASGLSPEDLENLVKQRRRWARGCIQTGRKLNILFRKGLNLKQKISYLSSIGYWYDSLKRFIYIIAPILYGAFGITVFVANPLSLLVFWLPMYIINAFTLKYLSGSIRTLRWTNVYETILFPLLMGDVILEMFGISKNVFAVTDKGKKREERNDIRMAVPHLVLTALTLYSMLRCFYIVFSTGSISILFLVFWLIMNLYHLIMALFFMLGRKVHRRSERFAIEVAGEIGSVTEKATFCTHDISEGGFSFWLEKPVYISPDVSHPVTFKTDCYQASCEAKIVQVAEGEKGWKYAFEISRIEEGDYKQLLHILHDRVPPLTKKVQQDFGFVEDLRINLIKRKQNLKYWNRKLPRIEMDHKVSDEEGNTYDMRSFNYQYITLKAEKRQLRKKKIMISIAEDIKLSLSFVKTLSYDESGEGKQPLCLYSLDDMPTGEKQEIMIDYFLQYEREYKKKCSNKNHKEKKEEFDELAYL